MNNCMAKVIAVEHHVPYEGPLKGFTEQLALSVSSLKSRQRQTRFRFDLCARERARSRHRAADLLGRSQEVQGTEAWFALDVEVELF